jgi:TetR/AcrR family transcriptional regulator
MPKSTFFNLPEEKRESICAAAVELFIEEGYDSASITQIVARAGIAKGSFYQYFEDKADLFRYLLQRAGQEKARFLAAPPAADLPPFAYLRALLTGSFHFQVSNPRLARLASESTLGSGPESEALRREVQEATYHFYRQLLQRGVAEGHLAADLNVEVATFICAETSLKLGHYILDRVDIAPEELVYGTQRTIRVAELEAIYEAYLHILQYGMTREQAKGGNHAG